MKIFIRLASIILIIILTAALCSCNNGQKQVDETTAQQQTEAPDLTSTHGYFDDDDHAKIFFRGQAYYNVCLYSGDLILDNYLDGKAYITSKEITDDSQAEEVGVIIEFNSKEQLPEILVMSTKDYFGDNPYDENSYPVYTYFCKQEQWSILGQKIRTRAFNNLYVAYIEDVSLFGTGLFNMTVGGHEMLDDETTEAIKTTVKTETDDTLDMEVVYSGDFRVFIVHRCDKNMLVDPLNDEYMIIKTSDNQYYIGDWYSVSFNRVPEKYEPLIADLMEKYSDTVDKMTNTLKEIFFNNQEQAEQL